MNRRTLEQGYLGLLGVFVLVAVPRFHMAQLQQCRQGR